MHGGNLKQTIIVNNMRINLHIIQNGRLFMA